MKTFCVLAAMLTASIIVLPGCHKSSTSPKTEPSPEPGGPVVRYVGISMDQDEVHCWWDDSVTLRGSVFVNDTNRRPMQHVCVRFSMSYPLGAIAYEDTVRRDTSNWNGILPFRWTFGCPRFRFGYNTVYATVRDCTAFWMLWFESSDNDWLSTMQAQVSPETLRLSPLGQTDSVRVQAQLMDQFRYGWPEIVLPFRANGGRPVSLPATDTSGSTSIWWHPPRLPGRHSGIVAGGSLADTLWVTVLP